MQRLMRYMLLAVALVALGKLLQRMGKPSHGRLAGLVPFDLRVPTLARLRAAYWDPENPDLLTSKAFGIGWGVNFGAMARKLGVV